MILRGTGKRTGTAGDKSDCGAIGTICLGQSASGLHTYLIKSPDDFELAAAENLRKNSHLQGLAIRAGQPASNQAGSRILPIKDKNRPK